MGLREMAEIDLGFIMETDETGFRWPITITDPDGNSNINPLYGISTDISQIIDPDTGQIVSGRSASVSIRISSLTLEGLGLPVGIAETVKKPWIIQFDDINGNPFKFKVSESNPDRAIGLVVCILEKYK